MRNIFFLIVTLILVGCSNSDNDDTGIDTNNSCRKPDGLQVVNITETSARFAWGDANNSTLFNVEYGIRGFTIGNGTRISVNTLFIDITVLSSGIEYDFYVRTNCGGSSYSDWSGPHSFITN